MALPITAAIPVPVVPDLMRSSICHRSVLLDLLLGLAVIACWMLGSCEERRASAGAHLQQLHSLCCTAPRCRRVTWSALMISPKQAEQWHHDDCSHQQTTVFNSVGSRN